MKIDRTIAGFLLAFAVLALFLASGCRREDWREATLDVPGLTRENASAVRAALARYDGVGKGKDDCELDFSAKTVRVRYDSMRVAQTNLRMAIEEKGVEVVFPTNTTGFAGYINSRK